MDNTLQERVRLSVAEARAPDFWCASRSRGLLSPPVFIFETFLMRYYTDRDRGNVGQLKLSLLTRERLDFASALQAADEGRQK